MSERRLLIVNEKGLHARASARFVEVVEAHDAKAEVEKDGMRVSGDSIMGLLMLAASKGTSIDIRTSGNEADKLALLAPAVSASGRLPFQNFQRSPAASV